MPIIIISSDSYKTGREISKKIAEATGYDYVDREILDTVTKKFNFQEGQLIKALEETPSLFGLSGRLRNRLLACIEEATVEKLLKDNVVCHGLAAHLYVLDVSHVIKVRVLSDPDKLVSPLSSEAGGPADKIKISLKSNVKKRKRWSLNAFGLDETDPSNYDMVINLSQIDLDEATKNIAGMTVYRKFQPITYSTNCLKNKNLASRARVVLMEQFPDVKVKADGSTIVVEAKIKKRSKQKIAGMIKKLAGGINGVDYVEVHAVSDFRSGKGDLNR